VHAPPGRQRRRQQHGVQGDSAERRRGHRHARGLLKRIGNKIVHATVDDFSVGDYRPWPPPCSRTCEISTLDLIDWVSPTKAVFMSEAAKARLLPQRYVTQRCESYGEAGDRHGAAGNPSAPKDRNPSGGATARGLHAAVQRADAFMASFNVAKSAVNNTRERRECVYPIIFKQSAHILEKMPMDSELGFFFGAYLR
jgi:hypothetical protein